MRHMSANRQWKVVDERYSGNVFTDDHWYSTHIPRIVRVRTTQTTQKIRKTAQYCANFYAKPIFELLKTWNRVKHRYGEHRRTTAEVPRQKFMRDSCVYANFGQCDWAFSKYGWTLIQTWLSNYIRYKMWDGITYPFPNFNGGLGIDKLSSSHTSLGMQLLIHVRIKVIQC